MSHEVMNHGHKQKQAVALAYDVEDDAPKVLAAGQGHLAEKIMEQAKDSDIPLYQDEKLVHSLMKLDIGELIPPELYEVVAEILVYVDKMEHLKEKLDARGI